MLMAELLYKKEVEEANRLQSQTPDKTFSLYMQESELKQQINGILDDSIYEELNERNEDNKRSCIRSISC